MKSISKLMLFGSLVLSAPLAVHAQQTGFSIGMTPPGSVAPAPPAQPRLPALPELPAKLPSGSTNPALHLKPLDLSSTHLAPPQIEWNPPVAGPAYGSRLPQVPYPLDPILAGDPVSALDKPGMCTDREAGVRLSSNAVH
jgi:hypothetical protein